MLFFVKPNISHSEILCKWYNDKENLKYMSTVLRVDMFTVEGVRKEIENLDYNYEEDFIVFEDDKPIGYCGIDDIDEYDKRGEVFFFIGEESAKGKGYGNQIAAYLIQYAFDVRKLNSLLASCMIINVQSQKLLERNGFKKIGIRRQMNKLNNEYVDEIMYDFIKEDYKKNE